VYCKYLTVCSANRYITGTRWRVVLKIKIFVRLDNKIHVFDEKIRLRFWIKACGIQGNYEFKYLATAFIQLELDGDNQVAA